MMRRITVVVTDEGYERLRLLKESQDMTWRQFFVAAVCGQLRRGIEPGGRRGTAYHRDLAVLQREFDLAT